MKKISTGAKQRRKNISHEKLTIESDLGDRTSCYCVPDESGRIVLE